VALGIGFDFIGRHHLGFGVLRSLSTGKHIEIVLNDFFTDESKTENRFTFLEHV